MPSIVVDFINKLSLKQNSIPYCYYVTTYGTTTGQTARMIRLLLNKKGINLDAAFSVKMVDTWTPQFNLTDKDKNLRITEQAQLYAKQVADKIEQKEVGDFSERKIPNLFVKLYYPTYQKKRETNHFMVESSCIGCGLCALKCPVNAIEMQSKRPVWIKEKCVLCLGCLHRCPKFSIQYGKKTKEHGQFVNPHVKL